MRRGRGLGPPVVALALGMALTTAPSEPTRAYVPTRTTKSRERLSWRATNCVVVRPHLGGSSTVNDGTEYVALQRAIDNWHRVTGQCSYLRLLVAEPSMGAMPRYNKTGSNENVVFFVEQGWSHDAGAAAITTVRFINKPGSPRDGMIVDTDIEMNGTFAPFTTNGDQSASDVENTLTHELGHVMGLDHPCDDKGLPPEARPLDDRDQPIPSCTETTAEMRETTMFNFADVGEVKKRTPEADDIRGICETYPLAADPRQCIMPQRELEGGSGCALCRRRSPGWGLLLVLLGGLVARWRALGAWRPAGGTRGR